MLFFGILIYIVQLRKHIHIHSHEKKKCGNYYRHKILVSGAVETMPSRGPQEEKSSTSLFSLSLHEFHIQVVS